MLLFDAISLLSLSVCNLYVTAQSDHDRWCCINDNVLYLTCRWRGLSCLRCWNVRRERLSTYRRCLVPFLHLCWVSTLAQRYNLFVTEFPSVTGIHIHLCDYEEMQFFADYITGISW